MNEWAEAGIVAGNLFYKTAEKDPEPVEKKNPWLTGAKALGIGTAGFALGSGAAYGTAALAEKLYKDRYGTSIPKKYLVPAAGFLAGGTALAGAMYRNRQLKEVQDAMESRGPRE